MNKIHIIKLSALAAAVASTLIATAPAFAQTTPPADTPPPVVEDRSLRVSVDDRDLTLTTALDVKDAAGNTIVSLPVGTMIGRERLETRFAAGNQPIRESTDLRDVTLAAATSVTDPRTGNTVELPAGTVIRVRLDIRLDANGNVIRDRLDLRAIEPDGTKVRIRDRAPEMQAGEVEHENEMENEVENEPGHNHRQRGRDGARGGDRGAVAQADRSGRGGDRMEHSGRGDRADRPERAERAARPERAERPERPERGGGGHGGSGPG